MLDEVVVVGYGTMKKKDLTGADMLLLKVMIWLPAKRYSNAIYSLYKVLTSGVDSNT